jgi:hypothetical protein
MRTPRTSKSPLGTAKSRSGKNNAKRVGQFRSTFEANVAKDLEKKGCKYRYEKLVLPYYKPIKNKLYYLESDNRTEYLELDRGEEFYTRHTYTPDFLLENGIVIEVKGWLEPKDRHKHILIKSQYPSLDLRFVFYNPSSSLNLKTTGTCAQWCDKWGFKYSKLRVPTSWIKEKLV